MAGFSQLDDIIAWKKARVLSREVYQFTREGSLSRDFGLKDQMRRSAVSVMANIAEGYERDGNREFLQFLSNAKASASELESHLFVALDAEHISTESFRGKKFSSNMGDAKSN